jgi:hypothetical protein
MKIDKAAIGIEVSWSFGDGDAEAVRLPRADVRAVLAKHGFDVSLIDDMSSDTALRKALLMVKGRSKTIVIQELRRPNKDTPLSVGVYQVQARDGESGDNVVCGARVRVQGARVECLPPEGGTFIVECQNVAHELARIANSLISHAVNRDISDAITHIGWSCFWITRRRNSGGVYFMHSGPAAERFIGMLQDIQALTSHSARRYQFFPQIMEVYAKPLTMAMWRDSARDQYEAQVQDLLEQLKKVNSTSIRETTLEKRAEECDRIIAQAESHRLFLAEHVEVLAAELRKVQAGFLKKLEEVRAGAQEAFQALDEAIETTSPEVKPVAPSVIKAYPTRVKKQLKPISEMSEDELFE